MQRGKETAKCDEFLFSVFGGCRPICISCCHALLHRTTRLRWVIPLFTCIDINYIRVLISIIHVYWYQSHTCNNIKYLNYYQLYTCFDINYIRVLISIAYLLLVLYFISIHCLKFFTDSSFTLWLQALKFLFISPGKWYFELFYYYYNYALPWPLYLDCRT